MEPKRGESTSTSLLRGVFELATSRGSMLAVSFLLLMCVSNIVEEYIYTRLPGFDFYWTTAAVELAVFALAARLQLRAATATTGRRAPLWLYLCLGVCMALSQSLGKLATKYVNFSVGTVFKCSKILPTMLISSVWLGRRYTGSEIIAATCMGAAATFFGLGASLRDGESDL